MTTVLLVMLGGTIGFFTAALCIAAGRADRMMETLEAHEHIITNRSVPNLGETQDATGEVVTLEKETLI